MKFFITKHCQGRFLERVLNNKCIVNNILKTILSNVYDGKNITSKLSEQLPRFILYVKNRYGADRGYNFIEKDNVLYIVSKRKGTQQIYDVITCYQHYDIMNKFKNTVLTNKEIHSKLNALKFVKT